MPRCYRHTPKAACVLAIVEVTYPGGNLLVEGFRCPICGEEYFDGDQVAKSQKRAEELGLFGPRRVSRRKLRQVGSSLSVTLDRGILRELLPHAKAGDEVEIGLEGDKIVIRRVDED